MRNLPNCTVEMDTTLRAGNELQNTVNSDLLTGDGEIEDLPFCLF
jgi:hypothetical protein